MIEKYSEEIVINLKFFKFGLLIQENNNNIVNNMVIGGSENKKVIAISVRNNYIVLEYDFFDEKYMEAIEDRNKIKGHKMNVMQILKRLESYDKDGKFLGYVNNVAFKPNPAIAGFAGIRKDKDGNVLCVLNQEGREKLKRRKGEYDAK